jgi:hypothetical protein
VWLISHPTLNELLAAVIAAAIGSIVTGEYATHAAGKEPVFRWGT